MSLYEFENATWGPKGPSRLGGRRPPAGRGQPQAKPGARSAGVEWPGGYKGQAQRASSTQTRNNNKGARRIVSAPALLASPASPHEPEANAAATATTIAAEASSGDSQCLAAMNQLMLGAAHTAAPGDQAWSAAPAPTSPTAEAVLACRIYTFTRGAVELACSFQRKQAQ